MKFDIFNRWGKYTGSISTSDSNFFGFEGLGGWLGLVLNLIILFFIITSPYLVYKFLEAANSGELSKEVFWGIISLVLLTLIIHAIIYFIAFKKKHKKIRFITYPVITFVILYFPLLIGLIMDMVVNKNLEVYLKIFTTIGCFIAAGLASLGFTFVITFFELSIVFLIKVIFLVIRLVSLIIEKNKFAKNVKKSKLFKEIKNYLNDNLNNISNIVVYKTCVNFILADEECIEYKFAEYNYSILNKYETKILKKALLNDTNLFKSKWNKEYGRYDCVNRKNELINKQTELINKQKTKTEKKQAKKNLKEQVKNNLKERQRKIENGEDWK